MLLEELAAVEAGIRQPLIDCILENLVEPKRSERPSAYQLAKDLIARCSKAMRAACGSGAAVKEGKDGSGGAGRGVERPEARRRAGSPGGGASGPPTRAAGPRAAPCPWRRAG